MNKKMKISLVVAILFLILSGVIYFLVLPRLTGNPNVDKQEIEDSTISLDDINLISDGMDGFEIDSDVGESDVLPLEADNSDPALEDGDMAVDFDLLTDDQRSRILAGELTMDELRSEMQNSESISSGEDSSIPTLIDTSTSVTSEETISQTENLESDVNYGEPDIKTDVTIPTLSAVNDSVDTSSDDTSVQEQEKTEDKEIEKTIQEVELDTTYDSANLHIKWLAIPLFVVLIIKIVLHRRLNL